MTKKDQTTIKVGDVELALIAFALEELPKHEDLEPRHLLALKRLESKVYRAIDRVRIY